MRSTTSSELKSGPSSLEPPSLKGLAVRTRSLVSRLGPAGVTSSVLISVVLIVALFAPALAPYGETEGDLNSRLLPLGTEGHFLGTDGQGRDILSRLMYGAGPALTAGIAPVVIAGVLGVAIGALAGLGPRWLNTLVMRTLDVLYAFPTVLLAIAISMALGMGLTSTIIALSAALTPTVVRMAEIEVSRIRNVEYMDAARTSGARWIPIVVHQVLPVISPPLIVFLTSAVGLSIVYAAGLSYLGLGITPPSADWGNMVNELQGELFSAPSLLLVPALTITVVSISFNLLGDGLKRVLNVRATERQS